VIFNDAQLNFVDSLFACHHPAMSEAIEPKRKTKKQQKADAHKQSRSARKNARLETLQDVPEAEADEDAAPVVKASKSKKRKAAAVNGGDEEATAGPKAKKVKVKAEVVPPPRAQRWICFCGKLRIRGVPRISCLRRQPAV
jgi:hypothetical protein